MDKDIIETLVSGSRGLSKNNRLIDIRDPRATLSLIALLILAVSLVSCSHSAKPELAKSLIINPEQYTDETTEVQFIVHVENYESLVDLPIIIVNIGFAPGEAFRENAVLIGDANAVMPQQEQNEAYHRYHFLLQTAYVNRMKPIGNGNYEAKLVLVDKTRSLRSIFGADFELFIAIEDEHREAIDTWKGMVEYLPNETSGNHKTGSPTYGKISYGDTMSGHLSTASPDTMQSSWIFQGQKEDLVDIEAQVTNAVQKFEPVIFLFDNNDVELSESMRQGTGAIHVIDNFKLPSSGTFRIQVSWQGGAGEGDFNLTLRRSERSDGNANPLCTWESMLIGEWMYQHPTWSDHVVFQPDGTAYNFRIGADGSKSNESQSRWTCLKDGSFKNETSGSVFRITVDQSHWVINNDTWTRVEPSASPDVALVIDSWLNNRCSTHPPARWIDVLVQSTDTTESPFGFHFAPDGACGLSAQSMEEADIIVTITSKDLIDLLDGSVSYSTLITSGRIDIQYSGLWGPEEGRGFMNDFLDFLLFENSK